MAQTSLFQFIKRSHGDSNMNESQFFLKPLQSTASPLPPAKRARLTFDSDENQMIIDAGQRKFGSEHCSVCGMVYDPTFGPDNLQHQKFHEKTLSPLVIMPRLSTKALPTVQEHSDGLIFKLTSCNSRAAMQMVEELNSLMDRDFGAGDAGREFWKSGRLVFVFVNRDTSGYDRRVLGCLVVDSLKYAYKRYLAGAIDDRPIYCILGVNRIWVCQNARRRKIATRLLDCARCNFISGYVVQKKHIAFSDPTPNGREFAKSYLGSESFNVY